MMRFVAAFQTVLQADVAMQAFVQGCPFVGKVLQRSRWGWAGAVLDEIGRGKWLDTGHRGSKSNLVRVELAAMTCVGWCAGMGVPMRRQAFAVLFFLDRWIFLSDQWPRYGGFSRLGQLDAIDWRQWLDIGHCRLEGSEVFRDDQAGLGGAEVVQIALGIERGHTARASGGAGLLVDLILYVAGSENAWNAGLGGVAVTAG